ncbi:MAG: cytochrome c [Gemmatimonadales bacterium]
MRTIRLLLPLVLVSAWTHARLDAQAVPDSLPAGVTKGMIGEGKKLFTGAGLCMACHGMDARGGGVGPDLTDTVWIHHKGSFDEIVAQVTRGIPADETNSGAVMPPRGGSSLNDEQIRAVAAYVWSLSRAGKR